MWPFDVFCDPTWRPVASTLLHFVWQGIVVAALWMVLFRCVRGCRKQTNYWVGLAGMFMMAACPVATFVLLESDTRRDTMPMPPVNLSEVSVDTPLPQTIASDVPDASAVDWNAAAWPSAPERWMDVSQPYLIGGWIVGLAILSGRLLMGAIGVRRLRRGRQTVSTDLSDSSAALAARIGLRRAPGLFSSKAVREAVVTGLLRPIVLLPVAWLTEMTPEVLEAVIAHELAHIRRFDLWVNLFQRVVETLLFYHPAVWWLSRRVRLAREMCCDELAAAATGECVVYATALELAARKRLDLEPANLSG